MGREKKRIKKETSSLNAIFQKLLNTFRRVLRPWMEDQQTIEATRAVSEQIAELEKRLLKSHAEQEKRLLERIAVLQNKISKREEDERSWQIGIKMAMWAVL